MLTEETEMKQIRNDLNVPQYETDEDLIVL